MAKTARCKLCGQRICYDDLLGQDHWRNNYCSYTCYSVDASLPEMEDTKELYAVPAWIALVRYTLIVEGEASSVYKESFNEEEDDIMRECNED